LPSCALPDADRRNLRAVPETPPLFTRTAAVFDYTFPLDKLVQAMNIWRAACTGAYLCGKLARRIDRTDLPDCVIPMPLHPAKLRKRGFNQSHCSPPKSRASLASNCCLMPASAYATPRRNPPCRGRSARKTCAMRAFCCDTDFDRQRVALWMMC